MAKYSRTLVSKRRIRLSILGSFVAFVLLFGQLVRVTLLPNSQISAYANTEVLKTTPIPAERGEITDRYGKPLALSVYLKSIVADPLQVTNPNVEAGLLAPVLEMSQSQVRSLLILPGQFAYIKRLVPNSVSSEVQYLIDKSKLPGISLIQENERIYPQQPLGEAVIGQTNTFGQGISGLEYQYNSQLEGKAGSETYKVTNTHIAVPDGVVSYTPPVPGATLRLTIDSTLQYYVEKVLASEMETARAIGGTAVIMDVKTGQILAMVSLSAPPLPGTPLTPPGFPSGATPVDVKLSLPTESWVNTAVDSVYEPGSVAKIATFTAALEHHVITPTSKFLVPDQLYIDGSRFHDAEPHPTEVMPVGQILGQSSNIGTIMIAEKLGKYTLTKSFARYGWGQSTGLNFPGETTGYLKNPSTWSGTAIGSVPIGQDEAVTPLQVLDSYNAVANGGVMETPKLVDKIIEPNGKSVTPYSRPSKRIVSKKVAAQMRLLFENAVKANGTAPAAAIAGYQVAGKTGTSQKPWPNASGYQPGAFWGTFVGFVPATHPVLSAIVELNQPTPIYGGSVAAPVFSQIMAYALQRYGIEPNGQIVGATPSVTAKLDTVKSSSVNIRNNNTVSGAGWTRFVR